MEFWEGLEINGCSMCFELETLLSHGLYYMNVNDYFHYKMIHKSKLQ
jgi:hypothetical protein